MEKSLPFPENYYGIHVHLPDCEVGQNENVFIAARKAKSSDDPILDGLKKAILKHFPDLEGNMKVIQYRDLKPGDRLFFFDGFFLNEPSYPIASEKKRPLASMPVAQAA